MDHIPNLEKDPICLKIILLNLVEPQWFISAEWGADSTLAHLPRNSQKKGQYCSWTNVNSEWSQLKFCHSSGLHFNTYTEWVGAS